MSLAERLSSISQPRALRDGPLENLWAGGGGGGNGRSTKKKSRKGKLNEKKILARQLILLRPKKNSYKEFDDEKNSCSSKIPLSPPP